MERWLIHHAASRQEPEHKSTGGTWIDNIMQDPRVVALKSYLTKVGTPFLPSIKAYKVEEMEATYKKENVKRAQFWYGPFPLSTAVVSEIMAISDCPTLISL